MRNRLKRNRCFVTEPCVRSFKLLLRVSFGILPASCHDDSVKLWHVLANLNLLVLAVDHFTTSAMGILFPKQAARLYRHMFGAEMPLTEELIAVLKPWGALGIFAAIVGVLPVLDPVRYRGILFALLILLLMRILIRLSNTKRAQQHFGVSPVRNLFHIGLILFCACMITGQILLW